jgi:hypothetical protein
MLDKLDWAAALPCSRTLDFFGVVVDVRTSTGDQDYVDFFFRYHQTDRREPQVVVALAADDGSDFFASLLAKDRRPKRWAIADDTSGDIITGAFTAWSGVPSVVPPFGSRRLADRLVVTPASVLTNRSGTTVALRGANYAGKTELSINLLRRGWRLVSDHLLIIETRDGSVHRYRAPLGLRQHLLDQYADALRSNPHRATISPDTGRVALIHADAIVPRAFDPKRVLPPVGVLVKLVDDTDQPPLRLTKTASRYRFFTQTGSAKKHGTLANPNYATNVTDFLPETTWRLNMSAIGGDSAQAAALLDTL